jgi:hypothetical protein
MAIVNKANDPVQVRLDGGMHRAKECWKLTAPALDAKDGVTFARADTVERPDTRVCSGPVEIVTWLSCILTRGASEVNGLRGNMRQILVEDIHMEAKMSDVASGVRH